MSKHYWLMKTEPSAWSWADQLREGIAYWDGVRNYQAANNMKAMQPGDLVFFYESMVGKCIRGILEVVRAAYPDPKDNKWVRVDVKPIQTIIEPITLAQIKAELKLADLPLLRQSRLSVMPISAVEWKQILALEVKPQAGGRK